MAKTQGVTICRIPGCEEPIMFVDNPAGRAVCLEVTPQDDGSFYINDNGHAIRVTSNTVLASDERLYICHTERHPELRRQK